MTQPHTDTHTYTQMTHFLRYKNKGVIEKSLTSLISLTPPFSFYAFSSAQTQIYLYS